jgi:hypothetical protein
MNSSKFTMTLDLHKSQSQYSISAIVGDTNRKLLINITDGGAPYKITDGSSAFISIKRPNNTEIEDCCLIKNNTVIEYKFTKDTCAAEGIHNCEITLYSLEGEVLGSPKFTMVVHNRAVNYSVDTGAESWQIIDEARAEEGNRQKAEAARVTAEEAREANEKVRKNNEKVRNDNEAVRTSNEEERKINEDDRRFYESERQLVENERRAAEDERKSKDAERDAKINGAVNASQKAEQNSLEAIRQAGNAYDIAQGSYNYSVQANENANEAKNQSNATRTSLINLSAQVQGISRTYVIPTFLEFIDFLNDQYEVILREDRDGNGVNELYRIGVASLKSGDNIIITEKGVPDFWFELNGALTEFDTYTYNGTEYSLGVIIGGMTLGGAHILETDYTVIEGHALSAAASATDALAAKNDAERAAKEAADSAGEAKSAANTAEEVFASIPEDYTELSYKINAVSVKERSNNLLNLDTMEYGKYIMDTGAGGANDNYNVTDYIPVNPGETLRMQLKMYNNRYDTETNQYGFNMTFLAAYDKNKQYVSGAKNAKTYIVPENVAYVRVTIFAKYFKNEFSDVALIISDSSDIQPYEPFYERVVIKPEALPKTIKSKSISIDNTVQPLNSSVTLTVPQLKKNKTIAFSGIFTGNLTELSIVQGEGSGFTEAKCVVTATSITIIKNNATVYTAEHGLTFGTHFSLVLATKNANKTKVYLASGGNNFTSAEFIWNSSKSALKLYTNTPFTHYQFTFGSSDFDKKLWMYGDSYFDHWLPISIDRGYTNCLTDGYSGCTSKASRDSFELAIQHGTPNVVVWCLGMNNGDNGAVNSSWLESINAVKEICDSKGIDLWVTTIPNTPTVDNSYKNAYIRENFKYIDISKYVGAEESTAWYDGLLSTDNVHPSTKGDFYIAGVMETCFPEMLEV